MKSLESAVGFVLDWFRRKQVSLYLNYWYMSM